RLRAELASAQRAGDLARASEIAYGQIPQIEKQLAEAEANEADASGPLTPEVVDAEQIAQVVSRWTGVPVDKMLEGEREKLLQMEDALARRVVGQDEALAAVSDAVRRARAGLNDPNRPLGSFLFLGPTGVGKTELTKALAEFLFDDEAAITRRLRRTGRPRARRPARPASPAPPLPAPPVSRPPPLTPAPHGARPASAILPAAPHLVRPVGPIPPRDRLSVGGRILPAEPRA